MKKMMLLVILVIIALSAIAVYSSPKDVVPIKPENIKKIELISLEGEVIKEFEQSDFSKIIGYYNDSTKDDSAHIEMIAGSMLSIELMDGGSLTFTSYGSNTNIVAGGTVGGHQISYHLISPELAKLLLDR